MLGVTSGTRNGVWSEPCCAVDWEEIMGPGRVGTIEEQFFDLSVCVLSLVEEELRYKQRSSTVSSPGQASVV